MKNIIQRNLPLNVKYSLISVNYISLESGGCTCDNCGKFISNIATIRSENKIYNIGLDCLDSILENNNLLNDSDYLKYQYSDKPAIQKAKSLRSKILKRIKDNKDFIAKLKVFDDCFGFSFYIKNGDFLNGKIFDKQLGFDFTFNLEYKDLTLNYLKGLYK